MSEKKVTICDACSEIITKRSELFHIQMMSESFVDAAGQGGQHHYEELDFCPKCAGHISQSLKIIAEKLTNKETT